MKKILSIAVASTFAALTLTQGASAAPKVGDVFSKLSDIKACNSEQCVINKYNITDALGENCTLSKEILNVLGTSGKLPSCLDVESLKEIFSGCNDGNCIIDIFGGSCQIPDTPEQDIPETETPEENLPEIPEQDIPDEAPDTPETPEEPEINVPDSAPDTDTSPDTNGNGGSNDNGTQDAPSYETEFSKFVNEVIRLVNVERAANGLSELSATDTALMQAASKRAEEQAQLFSHTRPSGQSWDTVLGEYGVGYKGAGENVAYGQTTPEQVMNAWMNSSGHRANILGANYKNIGVGVYYQNGTYYWAQLFTY